MNNKDRSNSRKEESSTRMISWGSDEPFHPRMIVDQLEANRQRYNAKMTALGKWNKIIGKPVHVEPFPKSLVFHQDIPFFEQLAQQRAPEAKTTPEKGLPEQPVKVFKWVMNAPSSLTSASCREKYSADQIKEKQMKDKEYRAERRANLSKQEKEREKKKNSAARKAKREAERQKKVA